MTKTDDRDRDERSGRYVESLSEEDILAVFARRGDPYEPLTAREIAEEIGFDRRTVDTRLRQMAEDDRVSTKKLGARARAWWLSSPQANTAGVKDPSDESVEQQLKRLSTALGRPITVGGHVFEDGDAHGPSSADTGADVAIVDGKVFIDPKGDGDG